jgi:hypothetical protein
MQFADKSEFHCANCTGFKMDSVTDLHHHFNCTSLRRITRIAGTLAAKEKS